MREDRLEITACHEPVEWIESQEGRREFVRSSRRDHNRDLNSKQESSTAVPLSRRSYIPGGYSIGSPNCRSGFTPRSLLQCRVMPTLISIDNLQICSIICQLPLVPHIPNLEPTDWLASVYLANSLLDPHAAHHKRPSRPRPDTRILSD